MDQPDLLSADVVFATLPALAIVSAAGLAALGIVGTDDPLSYALQCGVPTALTLSSQALLLPLAFRRVGFDRRIGYTTTLALGAVLALAFAPFGRALALLPFVPSGWVTWAAWIGVGGAGWIAFGLAAAIGTLSLALFPERWRWLSYWAPIAWFGVFAVVIGGGVPAAIVWVLLQGRWCC